MVQHFNKKSELRIKNGNGGSRKSEYSRSVIATQNNKVYRDVSKRDSSASVYDLAQVRGLVGISTEGTIDAKGVARDKCSVCSFV
ncbi:hypothetical protein HanXRQr2_Chr04g0171441 [Helianthus annuus]|uniref:Uncharacterized protein n=1 Tax=Helianthus annuus TaxID=4232 RepID=A0A251V0Z8_HELAN|nr:hypothetical protein HanXRQr2_Chr04g0171441 [Helianthus annuus]KAJ0931709.1 hypothetical protein HanPSC8_Chr04g0165011 [Helianthus annuus]